MSKPKTPKAKRPAQAEAPPPTPPPRTSQVRSYTLPNGEVLTPAEFEERRSTLQEPELMEVRATLLDGTVCRPYRFVDHFGSLTVEDGVVTL